MKIMVIEDHDGETARDERAAEDVGLVLAEIARFLQDNGQARFGGELLVGVSLHFKEQP